MVPKSIPGNIRNRPVVLVPVVAEMRKNKVRLKLPQTLNRFFDGRPLVREITLPEPSEPNSGSSRIAEKLTGTSLGLGLPHHVRTGDEPEDLDSGR